MISAIFNSRSENVIVEQRIRPAGRRARSPVPRSKITDRGTRRGPEPMMHPPCQRPANAKNRGANALLPPFHRPATACERAAIGVCAITPYPYMRWQGRREPRARGSELCAHGAVSLRWRFARTPLARLQPSAKTIPPLQSHFQSTNNTAVNTRSEVQQPSPT
jgi:hypothetical protein